MSRVENLLIKQSEKSVSLFGPTYLWNLLKITTLLVYLALIVYLAPSYPQNVSLKENIFSTDSIEIIILMNRLII